MFSSSKNARFCDDIDEYDVQAARYMSNATTSSLSSDKVAEECWLVYQTLTDNGPAIDSLPIRSWNAVINAVSQHSSKATARDRARQTWQYLRTNRVAVRPDKFTAQALVKGVCQEAIDVRETIGVLRECVERGGEVTSYQINGVLMRCLREATEKRRSEEEEEEEEGKEKKKKEKSTATAAADDSSNSSKSKSSGVYQDIIDATNLAWDAGKGTHEMHTLTTYLRALKMCGERTEKMLNIFEQFCGIKDGANDNEEEVIKPNDDILILAMQIKVNDEESTMEDKMAYFETLSKKIANMPSRAQNALLLACLKTSDFESAEEIWERMNDENNALYKPPDAFATNVVTSIMRRQEEKKPSTFSSDRGVAEKRPNDDAGIRNTAMEAFTDHVMRQATKSKTRSAEESHNDQNVAINLTVNVLKVLRDEIGDASLLKRQISSPSKVSEIRERAVVDAKSIVDITNAFLDVPKYNDRVTNAVLQVCAEARSVKEAKAIVEEYFAMRDDDPLMKGADDVLATTTTTTTTMTSNNDNSNNNNNNNSRHSNNNRQHYNYELEMVPNVFKSMQYNRFVREENKITESDILEYFMETSEMVPVTSKFIESACQACRDRKYPDALLKIYYLGRDTYNHAPRRQIIDIALSALSADGRWQDTIRIMNEDVLEATINTVIASEGANSSTSFVVDCDDPSKNKMMIPTDKIDEFGVKHLILSFVNAGEIDQAFSALRLCQFLTDKSCTEAFEIVERAKGKREEGNGEKKVQMS